MTQLRVALLLGLLSGTAAAQTVPTLQMTKPERVAPEPFSMIRGVRELADGRLLVSDWLEARLAVVDLQRRSVSDRGRVGAGPTEFRLPGRLLPFRGDSTLLVDLGNSRMAVIDADGNIRRTFRPDAEAAMYTSAADNMGRLYYTIPGWLARPPLPGDTVELASYDPATSTQRVLARLQGSKPPLSNRSPTPRVPFVIFSPNDTWAVSPGGRVAVVRHTELRIDWIDGRGVVRGPAHPWRPERVRDADRFDYVKSFAQNSPVGGRGDGGMSAASSDMLTREHIEGMVRASAFAETLPPFRSGDVFIDGSERLWLGRWTRSTEPRRYDVFDGRGRRIATVQLAANRRIAGFGRTHAYVVHTDDDGLETIERHVLPRELAISDGA